MQEQEKEITFLGSFYKFATTVDGGGRITFEVPQSEMNKIYGLMEAQGILLSIIVKSKVE